MVRELVKQCRSLAGDSSRCQLPPAMVSINCMSLSTPQAIFAHILAGLSQAAQQSGVSMTPRHRPICTCNAILICTVAT